MLVNKAFAAGSKAYQKIGSLFCEQRFDTGEYDFATGQYQNATHRRQLFAVCFCRFLYLCLTEVECRMRTMIVGFAVP